jgi:hypothetical protein
MGGSRVAARLSLAGLAIPAPVRGSGCQHHVWRARYGATNFECKHPNTARSQVSRADAEMDLSPRSSPSSLFKLLSNVDRFVVLAGPALPGYLSGLGRVPWWMSAHPLMRRSSELFQISRPCGRRPSILGGQPVPTADYGPQGANTATSSSTTPHRIRAGGGQRNWRC